VRWEVRISIGVNKPRRTGSTPNVDRVRKSQKEVRLVHSGGLWGRGNEGHLLACKRGRGRVEGKTERVR